MSNYCKELTKEYLMRLGITNITPDCKVFVRDKEVKLYKNDKYFKLTLASKDDDGHCIYDTYKNGNVKTFKRKHKDYNAKGDVVYYEFKSPRNKCNTFTLNRLMWA